MGNVDYKIMKYPRNILGVVTQVEHDLYKLCKLILNKNISM